jgi:hypothetical protein
VHNAGCHFLWNGGRAAECRTAGSIFHQSLGRMLCLLHQEWHGFRGIMREGSTRPRGNVVTRPRHPRGGSNGRQGAPYYALLAGEAMAHVQVLNFRLAQWL